MSDVTAPDRSDSAREPGTTALIRNGVTIEPTYAEAFDMRATALVITAPTLRWARIAATSMTGFATSIIACGVEAGIDAEWDADGATPDGRPGVRVLLFAGSTGELQKQVIARVGQCVLTSPGSACYAGLAEGAESLKLGDGLRYFADGWQISKRLPQLHVWRLPVMDGEFVCEATAPLTKSAVGGGNLIVMAHDQAKALAAAEAAAAAIAATPDAIAPFPGGIVRSGSKVGSKYRGLIASTNHAYCPTLRGAVTDSALDAAIGAVLELVIDGLTPPAVAAAMRAGLAAIVELGPERGACRVGAGNYGGKLGRHHFHLHGLAP
jgi:formylmethanofuran--tetrahydromethanopterin N-formyltransferase